MHAKESGRPDVVISPPWIIAVPFAAGMILQWIFPRSFPFRAAGFVTGAACVICAVWILSAARRAFRRARTSMLPSRRNRVLLTNGPFRFSRNPLYAGLLLLYAGISLMAGAVWPLWFFPAVVALLHGCVVLPEERYLERRFGAAYRVYRARVHRWL